MDLEPDASSANHAAIAIGQRACQPRLGDFTKLKSLAGSCLEISANARPRDGCPDPAGGADEHRLRTSVVGADPPALLGDFFRLYSQLPTPPAISEAPKHQSPARRVSGQALESCQRPDALDTDLSADSDHEVSCHSELAQHSEVTPSTTPPAPWDRQAPSPPSSTEQHGDSSDPPAQPLHARKRRPDVGQVLSYQLYKHGPMIAVVDKLRTRKQKRASLSLGLVPLRAWDKLRATQYPEIGSSGIHVFLDMSNINISFQQTLRVKYSVDERARFSPLPSLDLGLLTEILVRGRRVVALNAGCSMLPRNPAPRFIQELRDRGYHVDLRERKRVVAGSAKLPRGRPGVGASSSDEMSAGAGTVRYIEDLVDETLQTRIAESVMEYFQAPGTLVIATGDAQPAKYSDGFFTYAERALKMGWNVEVVSWRRSLSSYWRDSEWTARWGSRFRTIELDEFIDDLLACQI